MAETAAYAQFRYQPDDGIFEASVSGFSAGAIDDADEQAVSQLASRWACVEVLTGIPGVQAASGTGETVISVEPRKLFAGSTKTETLMRFLSCLSYVLPSYPNDGTDHVIGLEAACSRGVSGLAMSAYDQYQRWLDNGPVGDETLRRVLSAAVLPMRPEMPQTVLDRTFKYRAGGETEHASIGEGSTHTTVSLLLGEFNDTDYYSESADQTGPWWKVEDVYLLRHAEIRRATDDSFGVLPAVRQSFMPNGPRLYEMQTGLDCISHPREIGGYLLAMGVMADEASRFVGGRPVSERAMRIEVRAA